MGLKVKIITIIMKKYYIMKKVHELYHVHVQLFIKNSSVEFAVCQGWHAKNANNAKGMPFLCMEFSV